MYSLDSLQSATPFRLVLSSDSHLLGAPPLYGEQMRRFTSNVLGFSILVVALSTLFVGVVWAGSSALLADEPAATDDTVVASSTTSLPDQTSESSSTSIATSSTSVPEDSDESARSTTTTLDEDKDESIPSVPFDNKKLTALVVDLSQQIKTLNETAKKDSERIALLSSRAKETADDLDAVKIRLTEGLKKVDRIDADLGTVRSDVSDAIVRIVANEASIEKITKQTSQLNEEGVYSGTINPSQLSRKLTPTDLSGDWPLDRTTGDLDSDAIKVSGSGCWPDYRYNIVLSTDPFGRVVCVRIAK